MNNSIITDLGKIRTGVHFKEYVGIILRRRWVILISLLSVLLSTLYYVYRIEDIYESFSVVVIEAPQFEISKGVTASTGRPISFYQGVLNSRTFLEAVRDSLDPQLFENVLPKASPEALSDYIQRSISLQNTEYSSFTRINVRAKTAELAYAIASVGTDVFRRRCQEVETEQSRRAVFEVDKQLRLIRDRLEESERDYRGFIDKSGNISKDGSLTDGTTQELATLQETYATNMAQLGIKQADFDAEKKQLAVLEDKVTPPTNTRSPEYLALRSRLQELEKEKVRLENLGIQLAGVSTIDREINEVEKQLLQYKPAQQGQSSTDPRLVQRWQDLRKSVVAKEAELDLFKRRLDAYRSAIANYKKENPNILSQSLELLRLKRSKEVYENLYDILLAKAEEERIKSASSGIGVKIVDMARKPDQPIPKNSTTFYLIGLLVGLGLGLALAFFIEFNDTTIKSNEDVERFLETPVLGTIPHITIKKDDTEIRRRSSSNKKGTTVVQYPKNLLNFKGDDSVITESYRSLRTNLSFVSPDNPLRTILLTSAGPGEGKSLTISNLAMSYAQMGKRTLLVDTDLRRPVLHHLFQLKREPGFSELFMENPDYDRVIRPSGRENLWIVTAGIFTPNPAELVGSQKMLQHIEYFKNHFDIVFFDTPPVVAVTDATLMATKVDGAFLVIKSHHTEREVAMRARAILNNIGIKILGVILNDINLSNRYSSYGYYKYYYHYYKSKTE